MGSKKTLMEKSANFDRAVNDWLEPFREWVGVGMEAAKIAEDDKNLHAKRSFAKKIGSNLKLQNGRLWWETSSSSQNPYLLLLRSSQGGQKRRAVLAHRPPTRNLVALYERARKYFIENC